MNEQNFAEPGKNPEIFAPTDQEITGASVAKALRLEAEIDEMPLDGTLVQEAPLGQTIIYNQDAMGETYTPEAQGGFNPNANAPLLSREDAERFRTRWDELQGRFVDEPILAVERAEALVAEVIEKITHRIDNERVSLADEWKQETEPSTETLRQTLQNYRVFFNRLLMQIPD